jgi:hypothetical protein
MPIIHGCDLSIQLFWLDAIIRSELPTLLYTTSMKGLCMNLLELKTAYLAGEITTAKITRTVDKYANELGALYPQDIPLAGKMHLYLHDLDINHGWCSLSQAAKSFKSLNLGFRQFCGNANVCKCNANQISDFWNTVSPEKKHSINSTRKHTVLAKYGVESVSQLQESKDKAEKTCLLRYGVKSPTQNHSILQKSSTTCHKNHGVNWPQQNKHIAEKTTATFNTKYGIDKPAQHPLFRERMNVTTLQRFGVDNIMKLPEYTKMLTDRFKHSHFDQIASYRGKITPLFTVDEYVGSKTGDLLLWLCTTCDTQFYDTVKNTWHEKCPHCDPTHLTWGEVVISDWLTQAGVSFETHCNSVIRPLQVDFYLPSHNLAIEFNGTYWHSELAGRGKQYHISKHKKCHDAGVKLIQIFEHELLANEQIIKNRLMNALGKLSTKMHARKMAVVPITFSQAKEFLTANHIQGSVASRYNYALVQGDEIYSVMTFGKSRFSKSVAEWELLRFATRQHYSIAGAASKLFAHFVKEHSPLSVVSYADLKWGRGQVYENMGFSWSHDSQPNYWYFRNLHEIHHRTKFQKHKLPTELHHLGSEWDIMKSQGWNRFWDCGNAVWIWKKEA